MPETRRNRLSAANRELLKRTEEIEKVMDVATGRS